jgi:hypothetical protein
MTYFPDGTDYSYSLPASVPGVINIGWLSPAHEHPKGAVAPHEVAALRACACLCRAHLTRGIHVCEFCGRQGLSVDCAGKATPLGCAEIWVQDGARVYAAPDLVLHYVEEHGYRPPDAFLSAVGRAASDGRRPDQAHELYKSMVNDALRKLGY